MKTPRTGHLTWARNLGTWLCSDQDGVDMDESGDAGASHSFSAWSVLHRVPTPEYNRDEDFSAITSSFPPTPAPRLPVFLDGGTEASDEAEPDYQDYPFLLRPLSTHSPS